MQGLLNTRQMLTWNFIFSSIFIFILRHTLYHIGYLNSFLSRPVLNLWPSSLSFLSSWDHRPLPTEGIDDQTAHASRTDGATLTNTHMLALETPWP